MTDVLWLFPAGMLAGFMLAIVTMQIDRRVVEHRARLIGYQEGWNKAVDWCCPPPP